MVSAILTTVKSYIPKIITKGIGIGALGVVAYDSHYVGKMQSDLYATEKDAASTGYYLNNAATLGSMSKTQEAIKNMAFDTELDQTYKRFFNEIIGYVKGFCSMLIENVVPFGLGLGALLAKGKAAKICAHGIGIYAVYTFIKNFFGIGTPGGLNKPN